MLRPSTPHSSLPGLGLAGLVVALFAVQPFLIPGRTTLPGPSPGTENPSPAAQQTDAPGLVAPLDPRTELPPAAQARVEEILSGLTLEERVGQVMMVRAYGEYYAADAPERRELVSQVQDLGLGGVIVFRSEAYEAAALVADLQGAAREAGRLPLLMAADFEWGAEFRIRGAVPYPSAMAVGATGDPGRAGWMGRTSARDARALGIHWIFAPVADVNVNPRNPVINVRSFGEDPAAVGEMVAAFVRGAQEAGVLATAKHFPGHGDTSVDSHIDVPVLRVDAERLQRVELAPFRDAIDAGVASIMTAHLSVPAVTTDETLPATLSEAVLTDLLRAQLGFEGLVVTDAMEMGGINRHWWSGQAAVKALAAGADLVLLPPFPEAVHGAIVRAVENGDLPEERLDGAVRRILETKVRLGLDGEGAGAPLAELPGRFAPAADAAAAREIGEAAVTLLRDRQDVLPFDPRDPPRTLLVGVSDSNSPLDTARLAATLRRNLGGGVVSLSIDGRTDGEEAAEILAEAARVDVVVMAVQVRVRSYQERIRLPETQERYAALLARLDVPLLVAALGSPYAVAAFPDAGAATVAYGWSEPLQEALGNALVGRVAWRGKLPVTVPGLYPRGYGLEEPALDTTLRGLPSGIGDPTAGGSGEEAEEGGAGTPSGAGEPPPEQGETGAAAEATEGAEGPRASPEDGSGPGLDRTPLQPDDLEAARRALEHWVGEGAFPGAVWAVGHRNVLVELGAAGRMSAAPEAPPMPEDAVFDLASVTKVVATTTVAMKAAETGRLRLDYPVQAYVPEFAGPGKEEVTIRHLLTHTSGLPAFVRYYQDYEPAEAGVARLAEVRERIHETELEAAPGTRYAYSDLGVILLGEVLERALGEPFHEYARRAVFGPLGMVDTRWNPPAERLSRIPPTEDDPWRGRILRGEVHDENAALVGGIAPHAGLFSTARDLSVFAQTLLNGGTYDHARILQPGTVRRWTGRQDVVADSGRALGWDTSRPGGSWSMFSGEAFGHTGFTGTSLWIDPERQLFVVLLTNRVHPSRNNTLIQEARIEFHTAVVEAVDRALALERATLEEAAAAGGAPPESGERPVSAGAEGVPAGAEGLVPAGRH